METGTARDTRKAGLSRFGVSMVSVLTASFGASLAVIPIMWLWDVYDQYYQPPPDYDPPPPNYIAEWVLLWMVIAAYGLTIGQLLHWLNRRLRTPKLPFLVVTNLLCGSVIGLALILGVDSQNDTVVDDAFLLLVTGCSATLWGLIFFSVRRTDYDKPKDVSVSAF